jgi:peptidyl-prolyl cis-trans isomerase SurA
MKALAAAALAAALAAPAMAQLAEGVAAVVNDRVISTYDVRQRAHLLLASSGIQPNQESFERARVQAVRDLVDERLQMQEAEHYEINVGDDQVEAALGDIARNNNTSKDELLRQLSSTGINPMTLRQQIRADMAWRRLINGRYGSRVRISQLEVAATLQRIVDGASREQFLISEIFLPADGEPEFGEAQNAAERLLQEMQRGAPFPLVARQFSAAPSAAAGGDLGWVAAGELRPEVQVVVAQLQAGQVSTPVRTPEGVYIVALRERREGRAATTVVRLNLRQVSAPGNQRAAMQRARARISTCDDLSNALSGVQGVDITDLGQTSESDLSDAVRAQIAGLGPGQTSAVTAAGDTASMLVVCARDETTEGVPSRSEIEDRLFEAELAMLSQRYLRDLRREATIITR